MTAMISYAATAVPMDTAASSFAVEMPSAFASGDFLVMAVAGGSSSGAAVSANTPSGWTRVSASGSGLSVFTRTAGGSEPASYTVTMASACPAAAYTAAYPAATVTAHSFANSSAGVSFYTGSWPSGVTSSQVVLVAAASVASGSNQGYQNVVYPSGLNAEVPVFGTAVPDQSPTAYYPSALGLSDVTGSVMSGLPAPVFSSPQPGTVYVGYLVLTVTGTASPLTVTATTAYPQGMPGMALAVAALTGAQTPAQIAGGAAAVAWTADGTSQAPQASITPAGTGSIVYGAVTESYGVASGGATYTALSGTTFRQNVQDAGWNAAYGTFRSTGTTTAGTPLTLGGSAPANAWTTAALAEILAASGSSLTETARAAAAGTRPGDFRTTAVAQSAVLRDTPAAGTLLVALVSANSNWQAGGTGSHNAVVTVADSSGLSWVKLAELPYPSYSGVWVAEVGAAPGGGITDESGASILDESGASVEDESGAGAGVVSGVTATASASAAAGSVRVPGTGETVAGATARAAARAAAGTVSAGSAATDDVLDESGASILDESGAPVLDESGGGPAPPPSFSGAWSAARAGMPGDGTAVNAAQQASQFLVTHGISVTRSGNRVWLPATSAGAGTTTFAWDAPVLSEADISQPFTLPSGTTAVGRAAVPLLAAGNGADLLVSLCRDNGSGSPVTTAPLAQAVVPASHIAALSASAGLAQAGPLQVSRYNASLLSGVTVQPWAAPAVSSAGAGNYAAVVTSGNWSIFIGGVNPAGAAVTTVTTVQYQGSGLVSGAVNAALLPQAAQYLACTVTSDTLVAAGGYTGSAWLSSAWTASWDGNGTVGAWSVQPDLPTECGYGAMASSGENIYIQAGSPDGTAANATGVTWWGSVSGGSVSQWNTGPRLPVPLSHAYLACVGNWLVCAGGQDASGNPLSTTWVSELAADGTPGPWTAGPPLPLGMYAYAPGWNLAVTDSAVVIVSGPSAGGSGFSPYAVSLAVSPDGPAPEWQQQGYVLNTTGAYQVAAYPSGAGGNWTVAGFHLAAYATAELDTVPLISVPLPASGLTSGTTYHLVLHQEGADAADSLGLGLMVDGGASLLYNLGGTWTPAGGLQVAAVVYDQTASGPVLHLAEDGGSRVTTLARDAPGDLLGVLDSCAFPAGSPEAVLSAVTQVEWSGGVPSGLIQLA